MKVCGIEICGSEARIVVLEGGQSNYALKKISPQKITLPDDGNADEVKAFQDTVNAFMRENSIDKIAIKKRNKKGDFASGPVGFKLEGIIQLYPDAEVILLSAQTIAATKRKMNPEMPTGIYKYQHAAFETAFSALP